MPPDPPSASALTTFYNDGMGGPVLDKPEFDWLRPWTSTWNNSLVFMLANDFKMVLSKVPHEPKWDDLEHVLELIPRKLNRMRKIYLDSLPPPSGSRSTHDEKQAANLRRRKIREKASRRVGRRHGVR